MPRTFYVTATRKIPVTASVTGMFLVAVTLKVLGIPVS